MDLPDSDDELEDIPDYMKKNSPQSEQDEAYSSEHFTSSFERSPFQSNVLDLLLLEHRNEKSEVKQAERKRREEMMMDILNSSHDEESPAFRSSQSLMEEDAYHLEQLAVKESELHLVHPGCRVLNPAQRCCIFKEFITPLECGYTPGTSTIDQLLSNLTPEHLSTLLMSKALITCIHQVSQADKIMTWLFRVMSVHSDPTVSMFCHTNLMGIIQQSKVESLTQRDKPSNIWSPGLKDLLVVLVNLGASTEMILGGHNANAVQELRTFIQSMVKPVHPRMNTAAMSCHGNIRHVLNILSLCLQCRPVISKNDLHVIFYVLASLALDVSLKNTLLREQQICLSSVLNCYSDCDWPDIVPELCRSVSRVTDHHHNQVYLLDLLTSGNRGCYLQIRLSYLFLHNLLLPEKEEILDSVLKAPTLKDIMWLGQPAIADQTPTLILSLQHLIKTDVYLMSSVLQMLDLSVGPEQNRELLPIGEFEYLVDQVNLIIRGIRDDISQQDNSKIKDALSRIKVKWCLTLQNRRRNEHQTSIFPCSNGTNKPTVPVELLRDCIGSTDLGEEEDDDASGTRTEMMS